MQLNPLFKKQIQSFQVLSSYNLIVLNDKLKKPGDQFRQDTTKGLYHVLWKISMGTQSADMPGFLKGDFSQTINQNSQNKFKNGKKVFPSHKFGLSYESPTYFSNKFSLLCKESYDNPFIKNTGMKANNNKALSSRLRNQEDFNINDQRFENNQLKLPKLVKMTKYSISYISFITHQDSFVQQPQIVYEKNKFEVVYTQIKHFKKQRCYNSFILKRKNDVLNVYGPLNMRDRPKEFRETKNYAFDPEKQRALQVAKSYSPHNKSTNSNFYNKSNNMSITVTDRNLLANDSIRHTSPDLSSSPFILNKVKTKQSKGNKLIKFRSQQSTLQIIQEKARDEDKFFIMDQEYSNNQQNSIIREAIKIKLDKLITNNKQIPYNSDRKLQDSIDEDELIVDSDSPSEENQ